MLERPITCEGCPLHSSGIGQGFSVTEGNGASGVYVCAEALGQAEYEDGLPLRERAPSGSMFRMAIKLAVRIKDNSGMDIPIIRESMAIANVCRCRPGPKNLLEHQPYEYGAIAHCRQYMDQDVERFKPKVMLAVGGVALRTLTGYCGPKRSVTHIRGFFLDNIRYPGIPVIGTYHYAYLAREKSNLLGVAAHDIKLATKLAAKQGQFTRPRKQYVIFPNISEAELWLEELKRHPELPIAFDIETTDSITGIDESELKTLADGAIQITKLKDEFEDASDDLRGAEEAVEKVDIVRNSRITQIQFSYKGTLDAIVLPWDNGPFTKLAIEVMALPNDKYGFNSFQFDAPLLRLAGARMNGLHVDHMWSHHHLQPDIPRGLQYAMSFHFPTALPWKHRAQEDPGEYGGDDVSYLRIAGVKLIEGLKTRGLWNGFERHVLKLWPVLEAASRRGIPVDNDRRLALGVKVDDLRAGVDRELQSMFPDELRNCEPKEGYVSEKVAEAKKLEDLKPGEKWGRREFTRSSQDGNNKMAKRSRQPTLPAVASACGQTGARGTVDGSLPCIVEVECYRGVEEAEGHGEEIAKTGSNEQGESRPVVRGGDSDAGFGESSQVSRWCRLQPFLPNSGQQIIRYINWKREEEIQAKIVSYRGNARFKSYSDRSLREMAERNAVYAVPKKFRTGEDTTEKKELERLGAKTKDRFFSLVVEHREYGKVKSTYVRGWEPAQDGRVHPTFGFGPATGQLSSVKPASMTMPKPGGKDTPAEARKTQLARWCRSMVVAPPGFKLVYFDKAGFHARTLGFNAQDALYLRIAKRDIHSFVTANFMWMNEKSAYRELGLPDNPENWLQRSDEELGELLKLVKKQWKSIRDKKAKPTILGIGLGLGDHKCFEDNRRDEINPKGFDSLGEVVKFKQVLKGLFPSIFIFHERIKDLAHRQGFLITRHGYMRWFFDVYHNKFVQGQWKVEAGKDAERSIALPVQNDAHGFLKEELLCMSELGWLDKFGLTNLIHDELQFCCSDRYVEECLFEVPRIMNQPSKVLIDPVVAPGGLVCEVESSVGPSWDAMETVKV